MPLNHGVIAPTETEEESGGFKDVVEGALMSRAFSKVQDQNVYINSEIWFTFCFLVLWSHECKIHFSKAT